MWSAITEFSQRMVVFVCLWHRYCKLLTQGNHAAGKVRTPNLHIYYVSVTHSHLVNSNLPMIQENFENEGKKENLSQCVVPP